MVNYVSDSQKAKKTVSEIKDLEVDAYEIKADDEI